MLAQRQSEILAKKAKLQEIKRQRELRARDGTPSRESIGGEGEVCVQPISSPWRMI